MERSEYPKEIRKRARNVYGKHVGECVAISFACLLVSCAISAVAAFDFALFMLATLIIGFPLVFCLHLYCDDIRRDKGLVGGAFFRRFGGYYARCGGVYRAFATAAKSILIYFLCYGLFSLIYLTARQGEPEMASELQQITSMASSGNADALYNLFIESTAVLPALRFSAGVAEGATMLYVVHTLAFFGPKTHLYFNSPAGANRSLSSLYSYTARSNWSYFHRLYILTQWPILLFYVVGFASGFTIANFYLYGTMYPVAIGFGAASVLLSIYFPYFSFTSGFLFRVEEKEFATASLEYARAQLANLHAHSAMTDEEFKAMSENLDAAEEGHKKLLERHERDPFFEEDAEETEDKQ